MRSAPRRRRIIANASGFSEGLSGATAESVAKWLFLAFVPLGILGWLAAIRNARDRLSLWRKVRREGGPDSVAASVAQ